MELQEYHVKRLFRQANLPVFKGEVAYTPEEAEEIAQKFKKGPFLIKAQMVSGLSCYGKVLPVGYNTKGCFCVATSAEVKSAASALLNQTPDWVSGANSLAKIQKVYIEQISKDSTVMGSLVFRVNFEKQCKMLMIQTEKESVDFTLDKGLTEDVLKKGAKILAGNQKENIKKMQLLLKRTYQLFESYGAVAVELNPIICLKDNSVKVLDGRLVFDPNSTAKFPALIPLIESRIGKERERMARQNGFRYMGLNGNIACVVNGIGLGWATIDLVQRRGGKVAALLDVGTEPTKEVISKALRLVLSEPNVDGVLVNVFGGLTRCDLIAEGLISAAPEMAMGLPIVIRMDGMNADIGQRMLFESKLPFIVKTHMDDAVRAVIKALKERR